VPGAFSTGPRQQTGSDPRCAGRRCPDPSRQGSGLTAGEMATVYLGIGSNVRPDENLRLAIRELQRLFGQIRLSPVYRSPPLGFEGDDFLNAVVSLDTDLPPADVLRVIEAIHMRAG